MTPPNSWADRKLAGLKARGQSTEHEYVFLTSCIDTRGEDLDAMTDDDTAEEVDFNEFASHCDIRGFCEEFGYTDFDDDDGLLLQDDWSVSYWKSTYRGCPCYFLDHSRIEYIWVKADEWEPEVVKPC